MVVVRMIIRMHDVIILVHWRMVIMHWLRFGMIVIHGPVMVIVDGMSTPICMTHLPGLETMEPHRVANDPDVARSQVIILVTDHADVFVTIPGVVFRDRFRRDDDRRWRRRGRVDDYGWRRDHDGRSRETTIG